jgi:hypothetical protein
MTFSKSTRVKVTLEGRTVTGCVLMASSDTLSLIVRLDKRLGIYREILLLIWVEDLYVEIFKARPVLIEEDEH